MASRKLRSLQQEARSASTKISQNSLQLVPISVRFLLTEERFLLEKDVDYVLFRGAAAFALSAKEMQRDKKLQVIGGIDVGA